jgi:retron-type reverse transcriptase
MKIGTDSLQWALKSLDRLGDSDLFTGPVELLVLNELGDSAVSKIAAHDLATFIPGSARRFIVPKDDLSYRTATQLDPLDSLLFTAVLYEYGQLLESRRRARQEKTVFSHRFAPDEKGQIYDISDSWNIFWNTCYEHSKLFNFIVILDIADFYNQIYHHTLENQLIEAGMPNQAVKWVMSLCGSLSARVSRGIPVGPHASHMLAEIVLCPIDNSLISRGVTFCRYVDDLVLFANTAVEARSLILDLANILDKQQKLLIQRHKTKILDRDTFHKHCLRMVEDRPIDDFEKQIVEIIRRHSHGDPYRSIWLSELSNEEVSQFRPEIVEKIILDYLSVTEPDYIRLRWFVRRMAQVGHPAGVKVLLREFPRLLPAMSEVCRYFISVSQGTDLDWEIIGEDLLKIFDNEIVRSNEYYQLSILSLFAAQQKLDNLAALVRIYKFESPILRREIILCAARHGAVDWLRELKEEFLTMDPWNRRAFLYAVALLPREERRFFLKHARSDGVLEELLTDWAKR